MFDALRQPLAQDIPGAYPIDEFIEISELKLKQSRAVRIAGISLPTLFSLNCGYGIGATTVAVNHPSGRPQPPLLPFLIIGFTCAFIFSVHTLYKSYHRFTTKQTLLMEHLDRDIITEDRYLFLQNTLRLLGYSSVHYADKNFSVKQFLRRHTLDNIKIFVMNAFKTLENKQKAGAQNLLAAQCLKLNDLEIKRYCLQTYRTNAKCQRHLPKLWKWRLF